jgi:hypothetical protein
MVDNIYKNTHLLLHFSNNSDIVNLLKKKNFSIGINSKYANINFDLYTAAREEEDIGNISVLKFEAIKNIQNVYAEYIEQLTRWNISNNCFPDPRHLFETFLKSLNYWYSFLKFYNIKKIFINEDPHRAFDLIIYVLAKYLNIEIYIFSKIILGPRTFIKKKITDNLMDVKFNFKYTDEEKKSSLNYDYLNAFKVNRNFLNKIPYFISILLKLFKKTDTYIYKQNRSYVKIRYYEYYLWLFKRLIETIKYKTYYKKINKSWKISNQDIVFYLHYQPERTSNPLAGVARSQLQCIKMLRESFPSKKIFVKEHPHQFTFKNPYKNRQLRNKDYMNDILNVADGLIDQVPDDIDFVAATLQGTVGLEQSLKGRNVICFGNPWYGFLDNIYLVSNCEELSKINFKKHNPNQIKESLDYFTNLKSARGEINLNIDQLNSTNTQNSGNQEQQLAYIKNYFGIS